MNKLIIPIIIVLALAALAGCGRRSDLGYKQISADKAKEMMDAGGVTVVDVRRADEYAQGHIPGAILLPNETIGEEALERLPNKEETLLVYCRSGNRSKAAAQTLAGLGYKNVYEFGGIIDWPYETAEGEG